MKMIIQKPCPVYFGENSRVEGGFSCTSCNKIVIDFTDKSPEEIGMLLKENMCGIFRNDQLSQTPKFSLWNGFVFKVLCVASFIGFNVSPVEAQETKQKTLIKKEPVCPKEDSPTYNSETDKTVEPVKKTNFNKRPIFERKYTKGRLF